VDQRDTEPAERSSGEQHGEESGSASPAFDAPVMAETGPDFELPPEPETGPEPAGEAVTPEEAAGKKRRKKRQKYEWIILVVISLVVALVVRAFLIQAFYIPSESMFPTLKTNDRVLVNKLAYKFGDVERGDIIVFHAPPGAATNGVKDLIKRVVGLPGDTIEGRDGIVYINGRPLEEPYLRPEVRSTTFGPKTVPETGLCDADNPENGEGPCYFMMGDNRQGSRDSTKFGPVGEGAIVGRAFVKIWPISDLGLL
jgi:signal peptidase I